MTYALALAAFLLSPSSPNHMTDETRMGIYCASISKEMAKGNADPDVIRFFINHCF